MLDSDLAVLYGVETKKLNQTVKRNIHRFPDWFMFQLTENEWGNLRSQFATSSSMISLRSQIVTLKKERGRHRKFLPFVFTEQGVGMLSAILKSDTAINVSIQIMAAFVTLRKSYHQHAGLFQRIEKVEQKQIEADGHFEKIFLALETKEKIPQQGIFFNGQIFDAWVFVADIIRSATTSIILVDNYIDESTLSILSKRKNGVSATIYSEHISVLQIMDLKKLQMQYDSITIKKLKNNHDRFLIIDSKIMYHLGASLKDLGKKIFAFSRMDAEAERLLGVIVLYDL